jgi:mannose-6-phosphate isomerase-like protein (cupin superfamily)
MHKVSPSVLCLLLVVVFQTATFSQGGATLPSATDLPGEEVRAAMIPPLNVPLQDQLVRLIRSGQHQVGIALVRRTEEGGPDALSHDSVTEVYYILRGSGTQVTGGTLIDGRRSPNVSTATGPGMRGTGPQNGRSSELKPGDAQIIPAGVPHRWSAIAAGGIDYLVFRFDPDRVLSMK